MHNDMKEHDTHKELDNDQIKHYIDEDERKHPPMFLLIFLTTFAVLIAFGLSFSAINYLTSDETVNTIISTPKDDDRKGKYIITYVENTVNDHQPSTGSDSDPTNIVEKGIYLINQYPTSDEDGKRFQGENYVYNFTLLIGNKTKGVYYELTAVPNSTNTLDGKYVKLYLEKDSLAVPFSFRSNGSVKSFSEYKKSEYPETKGVVIYSGEITEAEAKSGKINFVMRMWVSEDTPTSQFEVTKKFEVKVNTYARTKYGNK